MKKFNLSFKEAHSLVKTKRPNVELNEGFRE